MKKPHKCPTCHGEKFTQLAPSYTDRPDDWYDDSVGAYRCRTCNGTGVVWERTGGLMQVLEKMTVVDPNGDAGP